MTADERCQTPCPVCHGRGEPIGTYRWQPGQSTPHDVRPAQPATRKEQQ